MALRLSTIAHRISAGLAPVTVAAEAVDQKACHPGGHHMIMRVTFDRAASQSHWQDYTCTVEHGTAVVRSAVPSPAGFAFLGQEVFADDFRGSTVVFRSEFRVHVDTPGRAGLFLRVNEGHSITGPMTERSVFADPDNNITPILDADDWTPHEITARVPGDSYAIVLGIFLAAGGRIELRNPELIRN